MSNAIKLSSPATREFWEIPVLWEDNYLLALDKPPLLPTSPDRCDRQRPNLITLLHQGIDRGAPWAKERGLTYVMNTHRPDAETSGVLLLAKSKPMLIALANLFGSAKISLTYVALVQGVPITPEALIEGKLALLSEDLGTVRVDRKKGKRAKTQIQIREGFSGYTLMECRPATHCRHQVRAHLSSIGLPIAGDATYGGSPLLLSQLKAGYRLKPKRTERPLLSQPGLHLEALAFVHPVTGAEVRASAPWPKDLSVAVKYLRRYAAG